MALAAWCHETVCGVNELSPDRLRLVVESVDVKGIGGHVREESRRLAALMITDMVGYTRLSQRDEALALRLLEEHNDVVRDSVAAHGGREVKQTGDGFFVEFPSALQAVSCSIDIQRRLYERNAKMDESNRFQVRIGLHVGDVVHRDNDVFGDGVNITSRIEPLALPGGVCLSQSIQAQVWNKIDRPLMSLGAKELKNVEVPMEVFRVVLPWEEKEEQEAEERSKDLDRTRLAVLPLVNISQNPEDVYFADGMTEELIYTLSRIQGLRVIAQTSVMAYRGTTKTIREIGRELKVGTVLEGSVRKAGDRVRITVQLIDVSTEEHIWSERYDRELADVFEIQSEISMEVANGLKTLLKAAVETGAVEKPTDRLDAYTEYLKGRHFWTRRTRTALLQALEHFERAVEADPNFAKAHSGIADCYSVLANYGHESHEVALPKAKEAAKRAIELDPDLAEAHASLGIAYLQFKFDVQAAESELEEAIRLNPSYATARQWYSGALQTQMRYEEALEHALKAIELDPMAHIIQINAANILIELGRYEEAKAHLQRAIELEPDFEGTYAELAKVDMILWNWRGAEERLDEALRRNPNNASALAQKALLLLMFDRSEDAEPLIERARNQGAGNVDVREMVARFLRYSGRSDEAIALYEEATERASSNPTWPLLLALAHAELGQLAEAQRWIRHVEETRVASFPWMRIWLSFARGLRAAQEGDEAAALQCIHSLEATKSFTQKASTRMLIYFALGDLDQGFVCLEEALAVHDPWLNNLPLDPMLDRARSDRRFQRALEVMGLAKVAKPV